MPVFALSVAVFGVEAWPLLALWAEPNPIHFARDMAQPGLEGIRGGPAVLDVSHDEDERPGNVQREMS